MLIMQSTNQHKNLSSINSESKLSNDFARKIAEEKYKYGFTTDIHTDIIERGLNETTIRLISKKKQEPDWLLDFRLKAYHYCVDKYGKIFAGTHRPEDNLNCYDGNYAMHCGGGNTGCIGLSVCGMAGFTSDKKQTKYPLTQKQIETMNYMLIAEKSVFTHYEFDQRRAKQKREGKIDITYLHYLPHLSTDSVGKYLRQKISWYRDKIKANKYKFIKKGDYYEFILVA